MSSQLDDFKRLQRLTSMLNVIAYYLAVEEAGGGGEAWVLGAAADNLF
jgi:hypothetical protein